MKCYALKQYVAEINMIDMLACVNNSARNSIKLRTETIALIYKQPQICQQCNALLLPLHRPIVKVRIPRSSHQRSIDRAKLYAVSMQLPTFEYDFSKN